MSIPQGAKASEPILMKLGMVDYIRARSLHGSKRRKVFRCSLDHPKKGFYRSANAIFGKVGRIASEEVVFTTLIQEMYSCPPLRFRSLFVT